MLQRGLVLAAMLLACLSLGTAYSAEPSMQDVMARLKALEDKNQDLETKLKSAQQVATRRSSADAQVDKVLRASDATMGNVITSGEDCRPLKIGGYVDVSYQYNMNKPSNWNNNLRGFDRDPDGFNVHLAEINFERLPTCAGEAGFRVDLAYGTDARFFAAQDNYGNPASRTGLNADFQIVDLQQAYISYIAPVGSGITVDAGKFVTWAGAEVIEAADNINSSRGLLFTHAIPATHTGIRATYNVFGGSECGGKWTIGAALVNGWDNSQDQNHDKTLQFMSNWTPTKWFNWVVVASAGNEQTVDNRAVLAASLQGDTLLTAGNDAFVAGDLASEDTQGISAFLGQRYWKTRSADARVLFDTTMTFTPLDSLTLALNVDWAQEGKIDAITQLGTKGGNNTWYGAAAYAKWQFACNWYLAVRGEYFNDEDGARTGRRQVVTSGTATIDWKLAEPLHVRFEYRHDNSNVDAFSASASPTENFVKTAGHNAFSRDTQDTLMMSWLYKF